MNSSYRFNLMDGVAVAWRPFLVFSDEQISCSNLSVYCICPKFLTIDGSRSEDIYRPK